MFLLEKLLSDLSNKLNISPDELINMIDIDEIINNMLNNIDDNDKE